MTESTPKNLPTKNLSAKQVFDIKSHILHSLHQRNRIEGSNNCARVLIESYNQLYDRLTSLSKENDHLNSELKLALRNPPTSAATGGGQHVHDANKFDLEKKLFDLQQEITDLYREKNALHTENVSLNKRLQEQQAIINQKDIQIAELESMVRDYKGHILDRTKKIKELEDTVQLCYDEISANNLHMNTVSEQSRKITEDYNLLQTKVVALQNQLMDVKNCEFDEEYRRLQEKKKAMILDATRNYVKIDESSLPQIEVSQGISAYACVTVPTKIYKKVEAHDSDVNCVRWSPSGKLIASASTDRRLKLWTFMQGAVELRNTLQGCNQGICSVDFDPEEKLVLAGSNDRACRVWSCEDGRMRHTFTGHTEKVQCARFFNNNGFIVTGSADRSIKLWDMRTQTCSRTMLPGSAVHDIVCAYHLNVFISGHFDRKMRIWDMRADNNKDQIQLLNKITGLDILQDRHLVLVATRDDAMQVWDLRNSRMVIDSLTADGLHISNDICRPSFSPDGQFACLGGNDGYLYVWSLSTGQVQAVVKSHSQSSSALGSLSSAASSVLKDSSTATAAAVSSGILCVHWSPDGNSILSCEKFKKTFTIWTG